jgi:hypothetical protein
MFLIFSDPTPPLKNLSESMLLIITLLVEQAENYRRGSEQLKFKMSRASAGLCACQFWLSQFQVLVL